jgi:tRNA pseudouridine32 synthase/23S rRNA pseudouridine746 synthase/23S rRNA pseudouridine1911/1915/1917 synthase
MVVNKPTGLQTVATPTEKTRTAHFVLSEYIRKGCGRSQKRLYVVHRLDRDTSGTLIFAKSEEAKFRLQEQWKQTEKKYLAVVHGKLEKTSGILSSYLAEDDEYNVYSTSNSAKGRLSHTEYTVLKETKGLSLLEVTLLTGRKNQIRVHFAGIGHPIVGDKLYGGDEDLYLALVENRLTPEQRRRLILPHHALHAREVRYAWRGQKRVLRAEPEQWFTNWAAG